MYCRVVPVLCALCVVAGCSSGGGSGAEVGDPGTPAADAGVVRDEWTSVDPGATDAGAMDPGGTGDDAIAPPTDACVPDCAGRACGDDGCGGRCGTCEDGQSCEEGRCEAPTCIEQFPNCVTACGTRADCGLTGAATGGTYDADNYACQDGGCVWQGCNSDAECAVDGGQAGQVTKCVKAACGPATCRVTCATAPDCVAPGTVSVLVDADNWTCEAGLCVWRGCTGTEECRAAYQGVPNADAYVCVAYDGYSSCFATCQTPGDCVLVTLPHDSYLDEDNYTCESGLCRFHGCNSTAECVATYQDAAYACVASKYAP